MSDPLDRATFLAGATAAVLARSRARDTTHVADTAQRLAAIEARTGGRLGVYARDLGTGRTIEHRAFERFAMCSTFKALAVGATLHRVDRGRERLDRTIAYGRADLLDYAPVTTAHVAAGAMTVRELCAAAIRYSDNTAANLLLRAMGGPAAVTAFVRSKPFHDRVTRLDRTEPTLNTALPGDPRDTTSPFCMARDLALLLTGDVALSAASSRLLEAWMRACTTGVDALRAGLPNTWLVADKTGSGDSATRNDIALVRPPHRAPIVVAAYLTEAHAIDADGRNAALAATARVVAAALV